MFFLKKFTHLLNLSSKSCSHIWTRCTAPLKNTSAQNHKTYHKAVDLCQDLRLTLSHRQPWHTTELNMRSYVWQKAFAAIWVRRVQWPQINMVPRNWNHAVYYLQRFKTKVFLNIQDIFPGSKLFNLLLLYTYKSFYLKQHSSERAKRAKN